MRNALDPFRPYAFTLEKERSESGTPTEVATIFLTNRRCPWRCVMCDLWKNTLDETVPIGAIPSQIDYAFDQLGIKPQSPALSNQQLKLYNSGSFFDPKAIPLEDVPAIAERASPFGRVIVECHPALIGESTIRFRDRLLGKAADFRHRSGPPPKLEVAMGLETVHPESLRKLNKQMTLDQFAEAAGFLRQHNIAMRAFILVKPPWQSELEALHWAQRSLDFAFDCGASVAVLIPVRPGNDALDALAAQGQFSPPELSTLEAALD